MEGAPILYSISEDLQVVILYFLFRLQSNKHSPNNTKMLHSLEGYYTIDKD